MTINFSDFSVLVILASLTFAVALPVKFSASMFGARYTGLVRSFMAMFIPVVIVVALSNVAPIVVLLYPFILILSIKYIMGMSFIGSVGVAVLTATIYYFVVTQFASGISITNDYITSSYSGQNTRYARIFPLS